VEEPGEVDVVVSTVVVLEGLEVAADVVNRVIVSEVTGMVSEVTDIEDSRHSGAFGIPPASSQTLQSQGMQIVAFSNSSNHRHSTW